MLECWTAKASDRPVFATLVAKLEGAIAALPTTTTAAPAAASRQTVVVNDTYMTDEPEESADQYLASSVEEVGEGGANDEYLNIAAGLSTAATADDSDSASDIEC